jgi:hypothetical protein
LEELSQFGESADINNEEAYKMFKLQEMERLKMQEKAKLQASKLGKKK